MYFFIFFYSIFLFSYSLFFIIFFTILDIFSIEKKYLVIIFLHLNVLSNIKYTFQNCESEDDSSVWSNVQVVHVRSKTIYITILINQFTINSFHNYKQLFDWSILHIFFWFPSFLFFFHFSHDIILSNMISLSQVIYINIS